MERREKEKKKRSEVIKNSQQWSERRWKKRSKLRENHKWRSTCIMLLPRRHSLSLCHESRRGMAEDRPSAAWLSYLITKLSTRIPMSCDFKTSYITAFLCLFPYSSSSSLSYLCSFHCDYDRRSGLRFLDTKPYVLTDVTWLLRKPKLPHFGTSLSKLYVLTMQLFKNR